MSNIEADITELELGGVRFERLVVLCKRYFDGRNGKGSHYIFKTPWSGDPRINIQPSKNSGEAKEYQVQQVLAAFRKLQAMQQED
ncbi:hypothetical protein LXT21_07635 [Myxococcus sp. K38C18041901]|uniref:hypothetical protein n=1 Tax=Myxococcus guangdongensis TaxID=2906760 RepID=UPI0020A761FC|nr:hypothetical protein [Myxococcus guangdongensis]MCP3058638.1 hypothetical protein [Myxococcus guangdongensis]